MKKKKKMVLVLRDVVSNMFEQNKNYTVETEAFDDDSGSWILIKKKNEPNWSLEISFNGKGTKFTDFNVWKDICAVIDSEKIF